jgi:hypothetical protein
MRRHGFVRRCCADGPGKGLTMALQKELSIDEIRTDTAAQPRQFMSTDKIEEYADLMKTGVEFPGPVVFFDGSVHWLADGFHRVQAARSAGVVSLDCVVEEGGLRDAVLYSCGANAKHGIQRTSADKRRAVLKLLQDAEWTKWSNSAVAKHTMVSRGLVDDIRKKLKAVHTCDSASMEKSSTEPRAATRTFIHPKTGKPTQMKTGAIGKRNRAAKKKNAPARSGKTLTSTDLVKAAATVSQADSLAVPASTEGLMRERVVSGVHTFAAFCSANSATSVAVSIPPNEVEEIRVSAARIYEWLEQFAVAMDRVEGTKTANGRQKGPPRPVNVPSSVRQSTPSTNTRPESPDLFASLDQEAAARADASKLSKEVLDERDQAAPTR